MAVICITGSLPRDCETKRTQTGTAITEFTVPYDVGFGDRKQTVWAKCSLFGKRAETLAQYLTKGTMVMVTGTALPEAWIKDGEAKCGLKVNVSDVELHGGKPSQDRKQSAQGSYDAPPSDMDDSIPF
jgi:single-strand DNA-binding protein